MKRLRWFRTVWRDPFSGLLWIYGAVAMVFLVLAFLLADWLGAWYIEDSAQLALETKMERLEIQIQKQLEALPDMKETHKELEKLLRKEFESDKAYEFFLSKEGELISSMGIGVGIVPPDVPLLIGEAEGLEAFTFLHDGKEVTLSTLTAPLDDFGAELTVALDPSILSPNHNWPAIFFTIMAIVLTAGLALSWWLQQRIKARLLDINRTTAAIVASGDLSQRVIDSELSGPLAVTVDNINHMLGDVETAMLSTRQQANNIAHDLRTPLTAAYNQLQAAAQQHPELEHSEKLLANLQNTFGLLLQINRLENRSELSNLSEMDPFPCCVDAIELYEPVFQANRQSLKWRVNEPMEARPEGLAWVKADRALLMQSLCNLLDNASKYSPEGATIHLGITKSNGHLCIECSNPWEQGSSSADPDYLQEHVFERFFRADQSRKEDGNGLGLSFVKAAVNAMDGEVKLTVKDGFFMVSVCLSIVPSPSSRDA
ncbi:sensor histidine kinase [Pseudoteredinibacter isoporae]|uniref:sensor histidine kinase n=1 Tax=Pseudoteredinibacter isoporae TaxID=570281 RepID=UPI003107684F